MDLLSFIRYIDTHLKGYIFTATGRDTHDANQKQDFCYLCEMESPCVSGVDSMQIPNVGLQNYFSGTGEAGCKHIDLET